MAACAAAPYLGLPTQERLVVVPDLREHVQATLGDVYTVERELGGGGMSRVFVATERSLDRRVVIKLLPPELAAGVSLDRFRREIQLAARLQHPHIVPLLSAGLAGTLLYYTMPFVEGESLRARLTRVGELPVPDAVRVLRDVADALAYAHGRGVVHRDIKPENILLSGQHAVVADFGVAKALSAAATAGGSVTSTNVIVGTPLYMSPEQAAGDPAVDHRADVYALGILAYELLAGQSPFAGRAPQELAAAHIAQAPERIDRRRINLPPALAALVMRCLEKRPSDRPQTAEEVLRELDSVAASPSGTTRADVVPRRRRLGAAMLGVVALAVAAAAGLYVYRHRSPALDPRRVTVAPFDNQTGDPTLEPVGHMAADWLEQGLARTGILDVVHIGALVPVPAAGTAAPADPRRLAQEAGAGTLVSGSVYRQGDSIRLQPQITDVATGRVVQAVEPSSGPAADPTRAIDVVRQRVMGVLANRFDPRLRISAAVSSQPPSFEAYQEWSQGLDYFFQERYRESVAHFLRAASLDSLFASPLIWAGAAYGNGGDRARADSIFAEVNRSRERLPPIDRYLVDLWLAFLRGDDPGALAAARRMAEVAPRSGLALYLVELYAVRNNRPREALAAVAATDTGEIRAMGWFSFWSVMTDAQHLVADYGRELANARRLRVRYSDRTRPLGAEARAAAALGRLDEVRRAIDAASAVSPRPGEASFGELLTSTALELRAHGQQEASGDLLRRAVAWYASQSASDQATSASRAGVASALYTAERWREAQTLYDSLAAAAPDQISYRGRRGLVAARLGDRALAVRIATELDRLEGPYMRGENTLWRARIAAVLGDRERAMALLRQAVNEGTAYGVYLHRDIDLERLRDYPSFQEWLRPKG